MSALPPKADIRRQQWNYWLGRTIGSNIFRAGEALVGSNRSQLGHEKTIETRSPSISVTTVMNQPSARPRGRFSSQDPRSAATCASPALQAVSLNFLALCCREAAAHFAELWSISGMLTRKANTTIPASDIVDMSSPRRTARSVLDSIGNISARKRIKH